VGRLGVTAKANALASKVEEKIKTKEPEPKPLLPSPPPLFFFCYLFSDFLVGAGSGGDGLEKWEGKGFVPFFLPSLLPTSLSFLPVRWRRPGQWMINTGTTRLRRDFFLFFPLPFPSFPDHHCFL